MKTRFITSIALALSAVIQASCDSSPQARIEGTYTRNAQVGTATLVVTKDTMTEKVGPITVTLNYKVTSINGNTLTVEFTGRNTPPGTSGISTVELQSDTLVIRGGDFVVQGTWKRK